MAFKRSQKREATVDFNGTSPQQPTNFNAPEPVTRAAVEQIRGVNSDGAIASLIARGLVEEVGKAPGPGRPGLLGTTMGIVTAFTGMAAAGASGGLASISAGIAEALITTAFGLLVAIPAVWFYNGFTTKIENLTVEMTYSSKELIDYLIKSVGSEFGRSIFTKEFQAQKAVSGSGHIHG